MERNKYFKYFLIITALLFVFSSIVPEDMFARKGGGGSRGGSRSFGGSRSKSTPARTYSSPKTNSRSSSSYSAPSKMPKSSFGGTRMSSTQARAKYGTPRKTDTYTQKDASGVSRNYQMNDYGGYSSGLMRGYMMGSITSSMMYMPWYGAFWYSRPVYAENADGSVSVYPPTFQTGKLIFTIIALFYPFIFVYPYIKEMNLFLIIAIWLLINIGATLIAFYLCSFIERIPFIGKIFRIKLNSAKWQYIAEGFKP